ncbi:LiaF transmembrane domain-containing protein [Thermolongibacillus altinsuensis]|uniref:LiaF transmembrane domain-containing protein n=1 Tax=Thermolongibacillus altinsuensis TaxID=575256 RepID=UPI00242A31E5|nr:hypothetical protein [Thermolongibacillus altinsuensis]GMB09225.1 hypothetical protein B1no1_19350 [Thermolongibacillus altinsuensis]
MRKWRVGTVSMGASLILLGIVLFISQWKGMGAADIFASWWPFLLVLLGVEILAYLYFSRQEHTFIKYDFLSIIFIGALGSVAILFVLLSSTGILQEVRTVVGAETKVFHLPNVRQSVSPEIKRIVLQTGSQPITIEGSNSDEIQIFGTYQSISANDIKKQEDYVVINIVGDTMYMTIKEMPRKEVLFHTVSTMTPTVVVPRHLSLEVRGNYNSVLLYPRQLAASWNVSKAEEVHIELDKNANILVTAVTREMLEDGNIAWQRENGETEEKLPVQTFKGKVQLGNGTYHIDVFDSQRATVHVLN